jgi:hypothetical protein
MNIVGGLSRQAESYGYIHHGSWDCLDFNIVAGSYAVHKSVLLTPVLVSDSL